MATPNLLLSLFIIICIGVIAYIVFYTVTYHITRKVAKIHKQRSTANNEKTNCDSSSTKS